MEFFYDQNAKNFNDCYFDVTSGDKCAIYPG
jgi:hypothetical protein